MSRIGSRVPYPARSHPDHGDGAASDRVADQIVIYRDSLLRDFGQDSRVLAQEVDRTVRHEIAHHLGYREGGVAGLGL